MEAAFVLEVPAVEVRDRLVGFVEAAAGTRPLGWSLYLSEEWCNDRERRRKAKIPETVCFQTKPQLAGALCANAAGWQIPTAPILADSAYGDDTAFRAGLHDWELEYVVA